MHKNKPKGPSFFTTVLIFGMPLCVAQLAISDASYAQTASQLGLQHTQKLGQSAFQRPVDSFQGRNLRTIYSSETPSLADINTLESNLSSAKSQLATLKSLTPKDPVNAKSIQSQIDAAQAKVDSYASKLATAKTAYNQYQEASKSLATALAKYNTALESETALTTKKNLTQAEYDNLQLILSNKTAILDAASSNLATAKQSKEEAQLKLDTATQNLATATKNHNTASQLLINAQDKYDAAVDAYNTAVTLKATLEQELANAQVVYTTSNERKEVTYNKLATAQASLADATASLDVALAAKNSAQLTFNELTLNQQISLSDVWTAFYQANSELGYKTSNLSIKQSNLESAKSNYSQVVAAYNQSLANYDIAYANYLDKQSAVQQAQTNLNQAQTDLSQAQSNYDTNLIPDPASNLPVSTPGLKVDIYNQITSPYPQRNPNAYNLCKTETLTQINNNWGGGDIEGCGNDFVMLHYTGYLTPDQDITYLQNSADDGFYMELDNKTVINDWRLKGCGGGWYPVSLKKGQTYKLDAWFYEWGGGACSTLNYQSTTNWGLVPAAWYSQSEPAPMIHNPALLTPLQDAQSAYDAALAAYTTANSDLNSAQAAQQAAAQQATAGYYAVMDSSNILNAAYPALEQAQSEYDLALANRDSIWSKVGELEQATNNLKLSTNAYNSSLDSYNSSVDEVSVAQSDYDLALDSYNLASSNVDTAAANYELAANNLTTATADKADALFVKTSAEIASESATSNLGTATSTKASAEASLQSATDILITSQQSVDVASSEVTSSQNQVSSKEAELTAVVQSLEAAHQVTSDKLSTKDVADSTASDSLVSYSLALQQAQNTELPSSSDFESITTIANKGPEQGSKEIPAELSADNLMSVDLTQVDPTELTPAQADQLVAAALETFQTAEPGSPEYTQALDALYLAAEQDDIELSPELAAIPGLAGAVEVLNFLGNAGADMSPKVRAESKKIVVTAVVAAGVAVQAAAGAATSAAVSSGSSGSGSGSSRRKSGK